MTEKRKLELLDFLLDYLCEAYGVRETIALLIDSNLTYEELEDLNFGLEDIAAVKEDFEMEEAKDEVR